METIIVLLLNEGYLEENTDETIVDSVYFIDKENFNIYAEFQKYQAEFYTQKGLEMICNEYGHRIKYPEKATSNERTKLQRKYLHIEKEFKKELSLRYFVTEVLKAKKINYTYTYIIDEN